MPNQQKDYSHKPVWLKLGIKPGSTICVLPVVPDYKELTGATALELTIRNFPQAGEEFIHLFATKETDLQQLAVLENYLAPAGMIWVSYYKKKSPNHTGITEDNIRSIALAGKLVDVKVCSVSDEISALRLVIRKELRTKQ